MLAIYLNDHLAGATAGLELVRRARGENADGELGAVLAKLEVEIADDREQLRQVMAAVGVGDDKLKVVAGWTVEKLGRLKLNGRLLGYSPLSRLVELEGLSLGIEGKAELWRMLAELADPRLADFDFAALATRADRQRAELESHRVAAGRVALEPDGEG